MVRDGPFRHMFPNLSMYPPFEVLGSDVPVFFGGIYLTFPSVGGCAFLAAPHTL